MREKSATRSDETGYAATVRCRCGRSWPRESAASAERAFSCLHGNVAEKELHLIQFSTRCMAQLRARTPQIIGRYNPLWLLKNSHPPEKTEIRPRQDAL